MESLNQLNMPFNIPVGKQFCYHYVSRYKVDIIKTNIKTAELYKVSQNIMKTMNILIKSSPDITRLQGVSAAMSTYAYSYCKTRMMILISNDC